MTYYRISKYDPAYRVDGVYQKDEWTAFSDIGKEYDGTRFTAEEYRRVEEAYVKFVLEVCAAQGIERLTVRGLENSAQNPIPWKNGARIELRESAEFIKDCLRERCWGRLIFDRFFKKRFLFETGYEYYIYVGSELPREEIERIACRYGLFVEERRP